MLFRWDDERIRFMRDASEHSDFHALLAQAVVSYLGPGGHICDAGCGLGYLSRALAPYYDRVTAIDRSENVLSRLRVDHPSNLTVLQGDIHTTLPEVPYDKMVFCLFGTLSEILTLAKRQCRGEFIIIKKNWPCHTFSLTRQPNQSLSLAQTCALLEKHAIAYRADTLALELGQPLRSTEDALRFFRLYSHDPKPESITLEEILPRLERTRDAEFPYYLPARKQLGILVMDAATLPDAPEIIFGREV